MNAVNLFGIMAAVIGLATISMAIVNGDKTASIIGAGANGFAAVIKSATLQK